MRQLLIFLLWLYLPLLAIASEEKTYVVSVVPQYPAIELYRDWTPLLKELERSSGLKFRLQLTDSIPEFESELLLGKFDFAYANPYHAVLANKAQQYQPLIRDNERLLTGILVVRKDSKFHNVQELDKATIVFPSPNAFAASLYMKTVLHNNENIQFQARYAESHTNAIRHVLLGKAEAGSVVVRTLEKQRIEAQNQLRTIYQTPAVLSHPLISHPRVGADVAKAFQQAMIGLSQSKSGKRLLENVNLQDPVITSCHEYKHLESLRLNYSLQIHQYQGEY